MANDWNVSKPIDHTKIGDIPQKVRDVKSSAKIIIAKEHETPATDNAGGQHLMGAARVYLQSDLPALDPEGNSLDTSATSDNGRLSVDTAASNELRVYIAQTTGVSTGWENVRVARVKADEDIDANSKNVVNVASGTQSGHAIHVGQVDTAAIAGQLKLVEPATGAKIAVSVLDPPTNDAHIVGKKYADALVAAIQDPAYTGGESHTFDGGLIIKFGHEGDTGAVTTVTFGTAFPNGIVAAFAISNEDATVSSVCIDNAAGISTTDINVRRTGALADGFYWMAVGY